MLLNMKSINNFAQRGEKDHSGDVHARDHAQITTCAVERSTRSALDTPQRIYSRANQSTINKV